MLEINKIHLGDCRLLLKDIDSNSIDCCITDPPYKLTQGGCKGAMKFVFNQATDEEIKTGKMFEIPKFSEWMPEVFRVLKDGTHFYCMSNDKNLEEILREGRAAGFKLQNILVWYKHMHTPIPYYMKNIEFIVLFRKGRARKINNMGTFALIDMEGIRGNKVHPSEKPKNLFKLFIENSTNANEITLDPFVGGGCCALAVEEAGEGRKFIAIEIDEKHYGTANNRIIS